MYVCMYYVAKCWLNYFLSVPKHGIILKKIVRRLEVKNGIAHAGK